MTPHLLLAAAALAAPELAPVPRAVRAAPPPAATTDRMDVVFLAAARPVRVAVSVRHAGKSVGERWDAHVRRLFGVWDRDKDGALGAKEIDAVYPLAGVRELFAGGFYYRVSAPPPELADMDLNGDRRVSLDELRAYYGAVAADLVRPRSIAAVSPDGDSLTGQLFAQIDRNRDGKLTQAEVRAAERALARLDADEDECVAMSELLASAVGPETTMSTTDAAMMMAAPKKEKPTAAAAQDLAVYPGGTPAAVAPQVVKRYDKDGDGELTPAEAGFDPVAFARLDADRTGKLSAKELDAWRTGEPDAVVTLDMADTPLDCKATAARPGGGPWPKGVDVRQTEPGRVVLRVGTQTAEFAAHVPPDAVRRQQTQQFLDGAFPGKGPVTEKDVTGPQYQLVRVVFDAADANADGKLTRKEFEDYFALQRATTEAAVAVTFATRTPNLFQMLDDNRDGKLSVRELRTAWDRLIVLEPGDAAAVTRAVLQPAAAVRATPAAFVTADATQFEPSRPAPPAGPVWLRKMDRNGDGDVSRAEVLGDAAAFDTLDANGDQLISAAEAVAYDQKARPAKKPQPTAKK